MATPNFDRLQEKVLQWANRDKEIFGDPTKTDDWKNYIGDFLSYAADESYRLLRIPPLEFERAYTIEQADIVGTPNISVLGTNNWAGTGGTSYVKIPLPPDFVEMKSIRWLGTGTAATSYNTYGYNPGIVFNERTDERTFFDIYAETYSNFYWMRKDNYIYIKPAISPGAQIAFSYYRQLPALDSDYAVTAENYIFGANDANGLPTTSPIQPFLMEGTATFQSGTVVGGYNQDYPNRIFLSIIPQVNNTIEEGDVIAIADGVNPIFQVKVTNVAKLGASFSYFDCDQVFSQDSYPQGGTLTLTPALYFVTVTGTLNGLTYNQRRIASYNSPADQATGLAGWVAQYPTLTFNTTNSTFEGYEVSNWLKDQNERILIWGSLMHVGSFLDDDKIEARYSKKFANDITSLNNEETMRRAKGGNVAVHFNGQNLI